MNTVIAHPTLLQVERTAMLWGRKNEAVPLWAYILCTLRREPKTPQAIANELGRANSTIRAVVGKLVKAEAAWRTREGYALGPAFDNAASLSAHARYVTDIERSKYVVDTDGGHHYFLAKLSDHTDDEGVHSRYLAGCASIVFDGVESPNREGSICFGCSGFPEETRALHAGVGYNPLSPDTKKHTDARVDSEDRRSNGAAKSGMRAAK